MMRTLYLAFGLLCVAIGAVGAFLPLLPTVPFMLLAAFCFARSSPRLERRLLDDAVFGPHIRAWRDSRSVSRTAKRAAWSAFAVSGAVGFALMSWPWSLVPLGVAVVGSMFIASLRETPHRTPDDLA
jgi:uncharacterized protein